MATRLYLLGPRLALSCKAHVALTLEALYPSTESATSRRSTSPAQFCKHQYFVLPHAGALVCVVCCALLVVTSQCTGQSPLDDTGAVVHGNWRLQ